MKMVLKSLPDGEYIQLPEDFSGLELLAEVCSLEREKLDSFVEKQVIRNPRRRRRRHTRIPNDLVVEPPPPLVLSSEDKGDFLRAAAAMMPWTWPTAWRDDGVMLRKESSSKKPPTMSTDAASPDSVLSGAKRTLETSISSDDNAAEKALPVAKKKVKNNQTDHHPGPNPPPSMPAAFRNKIHPPPAMPAAFRNKILQLAGPEAVISEEKLLIQKTLTSSDVAKSQNRLSIPTKQVKEKFLTDDEERLLTSHDGKNVGSLDNVTIIEPSLKTGRVSFRMWKMKKGNGTMSISYVITKTWNGIKDRNQLEEGMTVQVWAIRVGGKLWLALVRLPD